MLRPVRRALVLQTVSTEVRHTPSLVGRSRPVAWLRPLLWASLVCLLGAGGRTVASAAEPLLTLQPGDRVAILGNTLADRMQHSGWLETYTHALHPRHELVFRNLGYSGDELKVRQREENFGSPDEWLTKVQASVVWSFFGYNEALRGPAGLPQFRADLAEVIDGMRKQKYDGKANPRLVFFSPIAHENLKSPHLPDGSENNEKLAAYTAAMREVCAEKQVAFVDLFTPTRELYGRAKSPLTMNGIHLLDDGERQVSGVIVDRLFGGKRVEAGGEVVGRVRSAVLDKNYHWFSRYRVVDGYNVFGGRSKLAWFGQSNADVMMREMEILDVMTANRDRRVWGAAQGADVTVNDANIPEQVAVKTNIPGPLPGGKHKYLGGREAIEKMKIAKGMQVNLFASEEQFPELAKPVQMAVDTDDRLFVSVWPSYPHWNPTEPRRDKILCLPDDDGDGVADRCVTFADELNSVTGLEFWGGGLLVAALPEIWFLKDTDGDDKADVKIRMLQGVCSADSHHSANAMLIGPDGWLYWSRGIFNVATMETPTKTVRSGESGVHRFNPRTFEMEFHFPIGPNPHGDVFDQWGYQFANDGTGGSGAYVNIGKGVGNRPWFPMRVRPVAATGILSSGHFPEANQGNFLICNCIGFLGVLQHEVKYNGAEITASEIEPVLVSSDPNFRPTDVEVGGDGALYVSDWNNAIIGHMQHNMRDPNRDHVHGRIYRVTAEGRPLLKPRKLKGKPLGEVFAAFLAPQNGSRYRARLELSGRESGAVLAEMAKFTAGLDVKRPEQAQALLECLWVCEEHRVPNLALLRRVFESAEPRVRAAAIRTLGHWAGRVTDWRPVLLAGATDDAALVRAEAVKAAVEFTGPQAGEAVEAVFEASNRPLDPELEIVLNFARGRMGVDKLLQEAVAKGTPLSKAAQVYALRNASVDDLLKLPKGEAVYEAILSRANAPAAAVKESLAGLSKLKQTSAVGLLLDVLTARDAAGQTDSIPTLGQILSEQPAGELQRARAKLEALAAQGKAAVTRQWAYAAWMAGDRSPDAALLAASASKAALRDWLEAVPVVKEAQQLDRLYTAVRGLVFELPGNLPAEPTGDAPLQAGIQVDYFEPNPPNVAVETLEKLKPAASGVVPEIVFDVPQLKRRDAFALRFSGLLQVPETGKYTFYLASDDGSRMYVDNRLLINNDRLQGMTEATATVDLVAGGHAFVVTYFDNGGGDGLQVQWSGPGFGKQKIPADRLTVSGSAETLHDVAIRALGAIPGHEAEKFRDLANLVKGGRSRAAAIGVLKGIAAEHYAAKEVPGLVDNVVAYLSAIPARFRTAGPAVEAVTLAKSLAATLPAEASQAVTARLENLDVPVIAIGTVVERMIFDKEKIVVQAGRPVEFRFLNTDNMPHNLAIVAPGALEEVGQLAEAQARDPNAKDHDYIPKSDKVLFASRLLEPGKSQALTYEVPREPGVYPYVCTYPGHWRRMFGALYVVENLEEYQANPEAYLVKHPLPIRDELLTTLGRNTEWKFDDLVADVKKLEGGRSFEVGRNLFRATNCVGCHRMNDEGRELGPDLTKLAAERYAPETLLHSLVEPSREIVEKYQPYTFVLTSGKAVTGVIVGETGDEVRVLVDPLARGEPVVVKKGEIDEREKATVSIMPLGLLGKLTREEILDLFAYVQSKGDKKHKLFEGHDHDH